jgi:hypothetical protein
MIAKVFRSGVSRSSGPLEYLLSSKDRDTDPIVLKGDANIVADLIDSNTRRWKYTSGVLTFADTEHPTTEQLEEVMSSFETFMFAGKPRDTFEIFWVLHTDKRRTELHYVVPRMDLETGQDLNIAQRGYIPEWAAWAAYTNAYLGYEDPHDTPSPTQPLREGPERMANREQIHEWVASKVENEDIASRPELIEALSAIGEITRTGDTYISVKPEGQTRAFRLKGAIYEKGFEFGTGRRRRQTRPEERSEAAKSNGDRSRASNSGIHGAGSADIESASSRAKRSSRDAQNRLGSVLDRDLTHLKNRLERYARDRAERFADIRNRSKTIKRPREQDAAALNEHGPGSESARSSERDLVSLVSDEGSFGDIDDSGGNLRQSDNLDLHEREDRLAAVTGPEIDGTDRDDDRASRQDRGSSDVLSHDIRGDLQHEQPKETDNNTSTGPGVQQNNLRGQEQRDAQRLGGRIDDTAESQASDRIGQARRRARERERRIVELGRTTERRTQSSLRALSRIGDALRRAIQKIGTILKKTFTRGPDMGM